MKVRKIVRQYEDEIDLPDIFRGFNTAAHGSISELKLFTDDLVLLCHKLIGYKAVEHMVCFYMQPDGCIVDYEVVGIGNNSYVQATPYSILNNALAGNASLIVLCHNHPSGTARPSPEDLQFTNMIHGACKLMYCNLVDHIIVNTDEAFSIRKNIEYKIEDGKIVDKVAAPAEENMRNALMAVKQAEEVLQAYLGKEGFDSIKAIFDVAKQKVGLAPVEVEKLIRGEEMKRLVEYTKKLEEEIKRGEGE